ncbi:hypothetical protein B0W44_06850 [Novibacillus thermophilus]|uniref:Amine oxidase domain-containing protein n=1 Tax=Novibacillus thermophilus TaxID=1471761 RepID=A0A1U9KBP5_9BACL|nr:hypothetical protein B0W44_06850 [Novibacillus thermophilus]
MQNVDVAIIGGGISGLTAANYLAKAGLSVLLIEKSNRLGGRARTVKKNGVFFNLGLHAFYQDGEGERVLRELDIPLSGGNPPAKAVAVWRNKMFPVPTGPLQLLSSKLLTLSGKIELARFMAKIGKIESARIGSISLQDWAEREIRDPIIRHLVYAICRTNSYVPYPDLQPAGPSVRQLQRTFSGKAMYVDKGWGSIVDSLQERATRTGVTILSNKRVIEIEHDEKVRHIRFDNGDRVAVPFVIASVEPEEISRLVKRGGSATISQWVNRTRPINVACLDIALRKLPKLSPDYAVAFWIDQPLFYSNQSSAAKMSEDGSIVVSLAKYLGSEPGDWKQDKWQLERAMDVLQPGWQNEVVARQFLPRMTAIHDFISIDKNGTFVGPAVPEIKGLYVTGDWTGRGEMLVDAALASAKRAAMQVVKEFDKLKKRGEVPSGDRGVVHDV